MAAALIPISPVPGETDFETFTQDVCSVISSDLGEKLAFTIQKAFKSIVELSIQSGGSMSCSFIKEPNYTFIYKKTPVETTVFLRILKTTGGLKRIFQEIYLIPREKGIICSRKIAPSVSIAQWANGIDLELWSQRTLGPVDYIITTSPRFSSREPHILKALESPWFMGQNLFEFLSSASASLRQAVAVSLAQQISHALADIHEKKILHGDFKSSNILVQQTKTTVSIKIIDFSNSSPLYSRIRQPNCTRDYTAPEAWVPQTMALPSLDLWGLGLVLTEIFLGVHSNLYISSPIAAARPDTDYLSHAHFPAIAKDWETIRRQITSAVMLANHPLSCMLVRLLSANPLLRLPAITVANHLMSISL